MVFTPVLAAEISVSLSMVQTIKDREKPVPDKHNAIVGPLTAVPAADILMATSMAFWTTRTRVSGERSAWSLL